MCKRKSLVEQVESGVEINHIQVLDLLVEEKLGCELRTKNRVQIERIHGCTKDTTFGGFDYYRNPKTTITANYKSDKPFFTKATRLESSLLNNANIYRSNISKTTIIDSLPSPVSPLCGTITVAFENNSKEGTSLNNNTNQLLTASETFQNLKNLVKIDNKTNNYQSSKQYHHFNRQQQQLSSTPPTDLNQISGAKQFLNGNIVTNSNIGVGNNSSGNSTNFSTSYHKNFAKIRQHDSDALSPRPRRPYQSDSSSRYYNKNSDVNGQGRSIIGEQNNRSVTSVGNGGEGGGGGGAPRRQYQNNYYPQQQQQQHPELNNTYSSFNNNRNSEFNSGGGGGGGSYKSNAGGNGLGNAGGGRSGRSNSPYGGGGGGGGYRQTSRYENTGRQYGGGGNKASGGQNSNANTGSDGYYNSSYNSNANNLPSQSGNVINNTSGGNRNYRNNDRNNEYGGGRNNDFDDFRSSRYNNSGGNYNNRNYNNYNSGYNYNNSNNNSLDRRYNKHDDRNSGYNNRGQNSHLTSASPGPVGASDPYSADSSASSSSSTTPVSSSSYRNNNNRNVGGNLNSSPSGSNANIPGTTGGSAGNQTNRNTSPTPAPPSAGRWVPPSLRPQHLLSQNEKNDAVFRRVRGILNKLTPEKFQDLSDELLKLDLNSANILNGVILLIFEKALDEPKYSSMYAQLCKRLSKEAPNFEKNPNDICTFLRLLLAICRDSFNNRLKSFVNNETADGKSESGETQLLSSEDEEKRILAKQRMLGNVKFIGELNKLEMLSKKILHQCIQHLLDKKKKRSSHQEMCEDMECLSQLLRTCGKNLDNSEQDKDMMNRYFERLEKQSKSTEYPPRIRFMLKDVIELRANNWVPRKVATTEGPVPIKQIRTDDDTLIRTPYVNRNRDMRNNDRDNDNWMNRFSLNLQPPFNDVFSTLSVSGSSSIMSTNYNNNRQYSNQRGNQNNHHNNYNNRYNKHNNNSQMNMNGGQHNSNNMIHNSQSSQYNQMLNNKELAPRFKSKFMTTNQDAVENLQMRPAANSLLFKVAVQNTKTPPMLPISTPPPHSSVSCTTVSKQNNSNTGSGSSSHLSSNHYPLLTTPTSINQSRPNSTPSSEFHYDSGDTSRPGTVHTTEKVLKSIASSPSFITTSPTNDDIKESSSASLMRKPNTDSIDSNVTNKLSPADKPSNTSTAVAAGAGNKSKKDKAFNKEEVLKRCGDFFKEHFYTEEKKIEDLGEEFMQLKVPEKCMKDVYINLIMDTLDKSDKYFDRVIDFLQLLRKKSLIKPNIVLDVFKQVINRMNEREVIIPRIATLVACLLSKAVGSANLLKLTDIAAYTDNGQHYPLFLLVLQQLHKSMGRNALEEMYRESKIDLMNNLPEVDRNKNRLGEILDDRNLAFLYPLLKVQSEMLKQLQTEANPAAFYKWIKTNVDSKYYKDPGFITALMTVILKYITENSTLAEDADIKKSPEKPLIEKEEALLDKYAKILETFLSGQSDLQLIALYALQVFCYNAGFPKGMLCRWFKNLYDANVIEEEAFILWKEEISDKYPGKGAALFQVNNWLTWLEEAESEDEDE